jgi:glycosyltransferase involved in cell wall biosynthesis
MDANSGGTTTAVLDIIKEQSKYMDLELYTLHSPNQIEINLNKVSLFSENISFLDYSNALGKKMKLSSADIFHGHALWSLALHQMASVARRRNKPYLISIHGMLEPWSLQQSKVKKNIALHLYQKNDLTKADCLHATADAEAQNIRNLGFKNPIAVIPNGINISDYPLKDFEIKKKKKKILFLSRIHYKKGIENLIEAWSSISKELRSGWEIEIAGNGEDAYVEELKSKITTYCLENEIMITGPKFGADKIMTYHSANLFILPTYSENFGMVVTEALSCGVPVITTKGTPWKDLEDYSAGAWIDIGIEPLRNTLETYLTKDYTELEQMGINGRKLVEEKYSIESVGRMFIELYQWILNKAEKPKFVI